jgi:hypothetical protein
MDGKEIKGNSIRAIGIPEKSDITKENFPEFLKDWKRFLLLGH